MTQKVTNLPPIRGAILFSLGLAGISGKVNAPAVKAETFL